MRSYLFSLWHSFRMKLVSLAALLSLLCLAVPLHAKTIYVAVTGNDSYHGRSWPRAKKTIQAGIDAAVDGDRVVVGDGTFSGPGNRGILYNGKVITVTSAFGPDKCVLDAGGYEEAVRLSHGETLESVLAGFTITNTTGRAAVWVGNAVEGASATIRNCRFLGPGNAGIFSYEARLVVERCVFLGLSDQGIETGYMSPVIRDCTFLGPGPTGVNCYEGGATIERCTFSGLSESAVWLVYAGYTRITDCLFSGNAVGCSMVLMDGFLVSGCAFKENGTGVRYGDIRAGTFRECAFVRNGSKGLHEGDPEWYFDPSDFAVERSLFYENGGSGAALETGAARFASCAFLRNGASGIRVREGGAVMELLAADCYFAGNRSGDGAAGGVDLQGPDTHGTLVNGIFVGNEGGAVRFGDHADGVVTNCTATRNGGGVIVEQDALAPSTVTVTNAILWLNGASDLAGTSAAYSIVGTGITAGDHNKQTDPLFRLSPWAGLDGLWGTADDFYGDLRLQEGSPAINAGTASAPALPATDILGLPRVVGGIPDMGAYEIQTP